MFKGPIALGTIRTSFVLGLRLFIQAATLLLVARMLEPEEFGAFAGITSLAVLLGALSTFGTNFILFGEISKESCKRNQILSYAIPITFLCGGILFSIYFAVASWLLPGDSLPWHALLAIGIAEILLQPLFGLMSTEHHALGRVARAQLMQNTPLILRLLTVGIIFFLGLTPAIDIYAGGYFFASMLALLLGAYYLPERWPDWNEWRLPQIAEWRQALGYAAINISKSCPAELDKTLAIKLLPLDAAGIYAAGARVVGAITLPVTAMTLVALPRMFRKNWAHDVSSKNMLNFMHVTAFAYGSVLAVCVWLVAPALEMLFGEKYQGVCEVIRLLCLAIPGIALRLVTANVLIAMDKPWFRFFFELVGMIVLTIVCFILVAFIGNIGLPVGLVIAEWCMAAVGFLLVGLVNSEASNK